MEKEKTRRSRSRATSRAATHPGLESAAAFHRDEVERLRTSSRAVAPRSRAGKQLSAWLPANTLALCGAEVPLFLALDKLDDLAQRVRSEGQEAQTRFLRRLEASLQVCPAPLSLWGRPLLAFPRPRHHAPAAPTPVARPLRRCRCLGGRAAWLGGTLSGRWAGTGGWQGPGAAAHSATRNHTPDATSLPAMPPRRWSTRQRRRQTVQGATEGLQRRQKRQWQSPPASRWEPPQLPRLPRPAALPSAEGP